MLRASRFAVVLAPLLLLSRFALAEAQAGDYIALHGEIAGCEPGVRVLDIAKVGPDGKVQFLEKYEIVVNGMNHKKITDRITRAIAQRTGREPKSLHVSIVDGEDPSAVSGLVVEVMLTWKCGRPANWPLDNDAEKDRPVPPGERPPYENDYDERVVQAIPPNKALQLTLDPSPAFAAAKAAAASRAAELGR